mmetsp:Transcript_5005/g.7424  ORF Transcript_5005/g.7424 Transcript_5005/m.7424 type:complete len:148 (+) Transcript_5005:35-478(+)
MSLLRNRKIPKASIKVFKNPGTLKEHVVILKKSDLTFPLEKRFEEQVENDQTSENPSGFALPLQTTNEKMPFWIKRTKSGSLPVYIDYKNGRSKTVTLLRRVEGDLDAVEMELTKITKQPVKRKVGGFEIKGNHVPIIRTWIRGIGF